MQKVAISDAEFSSPEMATFCNFFDRIARDTGASVIDCHHHSKGNQGDKRSADRASGSGVFARDPDALLDMTELDCDDAKKQTMMAFECQAITEAVMALAGEDWILKVPIDDAIVADKLMMNVESMFAKQHEVVEAARKARSEVVEKWQYASGWRLEPTLREFKAFSQYNFWFVYPIHIEDTTGYLSECDPPGDPRFAPKKSSGGKSKKGTQAFRSKCETLIKNYLDREFANGSNGVPVEDVSDYIEEETGEAVSDRTIRTYTEGVKGYRVHGKNVVKRKRSRK